MNKLCFCSPWPYYCCCSTMQHWLSPRIPRLCAWISRWLQGCDLRAPSYRSQRCPLGTEIPKLGIGHKQRDSLHWKLWICLAASYFSNFCMLNQHLQNPRYQSCCYCRYYFLHLFRLNWVNIADCSLEAEMKIGYHLF